jgi:glutaredoxin
MQVTIYTKTDPVCPYCQMAKRYLTEHGIVFREVIFNDDAERQRMYDDLGLPAHQRTVPQVFDHHGGRIGGYQDLLHSDLAAQMAVGDFNEEF